MTDVLTEANNILTSELPTITITVAEYDMLKIGARILGALQIAGVDSWEGFEGAIKSIKDE